jgi:hypothetical protein
LTEIISEKEKSIMREWYQIKIDWEGPLSIEKVIRFKNDGDSHPEYEGEDYGLYQIYGNHIVCGKDTLLYVGEATDQTFSSRVSQHFNEWLKNEEKISIYLGKVYDPRKHQKRDNWRSWEADVKLAEKILIYKYSPNYNNRNISDPPSLLPHKKVLLIHRGDRNRLKTKDYAPDDF